MLLLPAHTPPPRHAAKIALILSLFLTSVLVLASFIVTGNVNVAFLTQPLLVARVSPNANINKLERATGCKGAACVTVTKTPTGGGGQQVVTAPPGTTTQKLGCAAGLSLQGSMCTDPSGHVSVAPSLITVPTQPTVPIVAQTTNQKTGMENIPSPAAAPTIVTPITPTVPTTKNDSQDILTPNTTTKTTSTTDMSDARNDNGAAKISTVTTTTTTNPTTGQPTNINQKITDNTVNNKGAPTSTSTVNLNTTISTTKEKTDNGMVTSTTRITRDTGNNNAIVSANTLQTTSKTTTSVEKTDSGFITNTTTITRDANTGAVINANTVTSAPPPAIVYVKPTPPTTTNSTPEYASCDARYGAGSTLGNMCNKTLNTEANVLNFITFGSFNNYTSTYQQIAAENPQANYLQQAFNSQGMVASAQLGVILTAEGAATITGANALAAGAATFTAAAGSGASFGATALATASDALPGILLSSNLVSAGHSSSKAIGVCAEDSGSTECHDSVKEAVLNIGSTFASGGVVNAQATLGNLLESGLESTPANAALVSSAEKAVVEANSMLTLSGAVNLTNSIPTAFKNCQNGLNISCGISVAETAVTTAEVLYGASDFGENNLNVEGLPKLDLSPTVQSGIDTGSNLADTTLNGLKLAANGSPVSPTFASGISTNQTGIANLSTAGQISALPEYSYVYNEAR